VVTLLIGVVLVRVYFLSASGAGAQSGGGLAQVAVGTNLKGKIPAVDWKRNGQTLLVDAKGRVTRVWMGKLQPEQEEDVLRILRSAA
jgi:hypothetical protein